VSQRVERWTCNQQVTTLGKLFTPKYLCHQAVQLGTGQGAVMFSSWEGNRRPGGWMTYSHLQADCLYTRISSGPNAQ